MQRIAIFTTDDGGEVAIQVADETPPGQTEGAAGASQDVTFRGIPEGRMSSRGIPDRLVERTQQSLDEVLARARPAVTSLVRQMRGQEDAPDELEVEFGIQVSLEVGAYVAAASSAANFRVTMRWRSREP
ncbi:hypothetical protein J2X63_001239 [Agromyces sp. 3263]|uniref:CU044_2847 family protein n=1 Tax=Agromyces sp. 3263 TaxID=2817750 RepID=UPI00285DF1B0|nr:CU044_2847 family protein [Agromyces sp. 3263]MDR6905553.1 hypothetical protein [Agromyces sp. 3263]